MEATEVIDIVRQAIYVLILVLTPIMIAALLVGLTVSIVQALTQIQEQTLTFVPKLVAMLLMLVITLPFIMQTLIDFTHKLQDRIVHIE